MVLIELILFTTFILLSCIFIGLGLYRLEHTELSLVGFAFLFLLSMVVIGDNLTYKTGVEETYIYGNNFDGYHWDGYNTTAPSQTDKEAFLFHRNITNVYSNYTDDSGFFTTHNFGYLLAVMSIIGVIGSFVSIKPETFMR